MPSSRSSQQRQSSGGLLSKDELLRLLRPSTEEDAYVEVKGDVAILRTASGAQALLPLREVCRIAERFNLRIHGYRCKKSEV